MSPAHEPTGSIPLLVHRRDVSPAGPEIMPAAVHFPPASADRSNEI